MKNLIFTLIAAASIYAVLSTLYSTGAIRSAERFKAIEQPAAAGLSYTDSLALIIKANNEYSDSLQAATDSTFKAVLKWEHVTGRKSLTQVKSAYKSLGLDWDYNEFKTITKFK